MQTMPSEIKRPGAQLRLGILDLLIWMAGVAVVLALYRAFTDWGEIDPEDLAVAKLRQLAMGLAYGIAVGSLGLLAWRRFVRGLPFPSQPGHWLLVLLALACALDGVTWQVVKLTQYAGWVREGPDPRYYAQLSLMWLSVFVGSLIAMMRWKKLGHWRWLAVATALLGAASGLSHLVAGLLFYGGMPPAFPFPGGNWPYFVAMWSRAYGTALCLALVWIIAYVDRRDRDWLHWVGVVTASVLGLIEFIQVVVSLYYYA
jgi:hypothetical protein